MLNYTDFVRPRLLRGPHPAEEWLDWMLDQDDLLLPVAPQSEESCASCCGAVGYMDDGATWSRCWNCRTYDNAVDTFVPITYSVDAGLESMLHRYKDFAGYRWLQFPLASLLDKFIKQHGACIDAQAGRRQIDVATIVPSNDSRSFNHLDNLLHGVVDASSVIERWDWRVDALTRAEDTTRPGRGELKPSAYRVKRGLVDGASVLVLDDTWTSGSSAASAAAALKEAGARHVTVLSLGRQLNLDSDFGSTSDIYRDSRRHVWRLDECLLCS